MTYYEKYLKYKNKYLQLKNNIGSGSNNNFPLVDYENEIIRAIEKESDTISEDMIFLLASYIGYNNIYEYTLNYEIPHVDPKYKIQKEKIENIIKKLSTNYNILQTINNKDHYGKKYKIIYKFLQDYDSISKFVKDEKKCSYQFTYTTSVNKQRTTQSETRYCDVDFKNLQNNENLFNRLKNINLNSEILILEINNNTNDRFRLCPTGKKNLLSNKCDDSIDLTEGEFRILLNNYIILNIE